MPDMQQQTPNVSRVEMIVVCESHCKMAQQAFTTAEAVLSRRAKLRFATRERRCGTAIALAGLVLGCSNTRPERGGADAMVEGGQRAGFDGAAELREAGEPSTVVTGPITGGFGAPFLGKAAELTSAGYVEEEFFVEGDASAYDFTGTPGADGRWSVATTGSAHYKTRFLVRRPSDAEKFNGTVLVEWFNVSGGLEADPDFAYARAELLRSGFAYVGVSAQAAGVVGGGFSIGPVSLPLIKADPERYGSLEHPGDDYSYDIYTQVAGALRHPRGVHPFGNLQPRRFIGAGESQSAMRMVTYVDAMQPVHRAFDGFLIHSRASGGTALHASASSTTPLAGPELAHIRSDLDAVVLQFETETDVLGLANLVGFRAARQPDSDRLRTWEVAGTSHVDGFLTGYQPNDAGVGPLGCGFINTGPQHWVLAAAVRAIHEWIAEAKAPAHGAELALTDAGTSYAHDEYGNAMGGIRTAAVDVPIATYSGQADADNILCTLFGRTTPFSRAELMRLYPTHDDYVQKVVAATRRAVDAGFVLPEDEPAIQTEAEAARVPD